MTLCATGSISLGGTTVGRSVNCEILRGGTNTINMNDGDVRAVARRDAVNTTISFSDFRGQKWFPNPFIEGSSFGDCHPCWGGLYYSVSIIANELYFSFMAESASGAITACPWKTSETNTNGTNTTDGFSNTYNALNNASHPAGQWTATRNINGFSDYYLPASAEVDSMVNAGMWDPNVVGTESQSCQSTFTWSSTQVNAACACSYAPRFGGFLDLTKTASTGLFGTRAVRRNLP